MRRGGWLWIVALPAACIAYTWFIHALIVDAQTSSSRTLLAVLNGLPHAAFNALLLWVFGRTLLRGREPLVTAFAHRIEGTIPPEVEAYTRRVTTAWCLFFGAQLLLSVTLLGVAALDTWSLFVNVLSFPLVVVMFVAEYLYRRARFPGRTHVSIWKGVEAYIGHTRGERPDEAASRNS
jgi:uncharacterized membrane protein